MKHINIISVSVVQGKVGSVLGVRISHRTLIKVLSWAATETHQGRGHFQALSEVVFAAQSPRNSWIEVSMFFLAFVWMQPTILGLNKPFQYGSLLH